MHNRFHTSPDQLPSELPLFPLPGVALLPQARLPLNIFEPRYLNMVEDAMHSHQLIGMIQPAEETDGLAPVGCAGRIQFYHETDDGRMEILLTGICRFEPGAPQLTERGYQTASCNWQRFAGDFEAALEISDHRRTSLLTNLEQYTQMHHLEFDRNLIQKLQPLQLVNTLITSLPLGGRDKQTLLEIDQPGDRFDWLESRLALELAGDAQHAPTRH